MNADHAVTATFTRKNGAAALRRATSIDRSTARRG
jgi:hypothetical protein